MRKIAVIGSINMDLTCQAGRYPGKGETVTGQNLVINPGGKGANQAIAAARLGADVTMFGCVGADVFADSLIDNLRNNGVSADYVRKVSGVSSGIAMITVAQDDNAIVVVPGANDCVTPEYLDAVKDQVLLADIIILQNEIPRETVKAAVRLACSNGKKIIYNPAPVQEPDDYILENVDFITPNEHEVKLLFPGAELEDKLRICQGRLIVTLGAEGVAAWINGEMVHIPPRAAKVVDTTGAGDTFNGALAFALAEDYSLEAALRFANVAASLSTEQYGAQNGMPSLDQVKNNL